MQAVEEVGAGDGTRTHDVQLGNTTVDCKSRLCCFWIPHFGDEIHTVFNLIFGAPLNGDQTEIISLLGVSPNWRTQLPRAGGFNKSKLHRLALIPFRWITFQIRRNTGGGRFLVVQA